MFLFYIVLDWNESTAVHRLVFVIVICMHWHMLVFIVFIIRLSSLTSLITQLFAIILVRIYCAEKDE